MQREWIQSRFRLLMYLQANRNVSLTAFNADEILTSVTQKATKERKCKEEYAESKQGDLSIVDWRKGRDPTLSEGGGRRIGCAKTLARAHSVGDLNFNLTATTSPTYINEHLHSVRDTPSRCLSCAQSLSRASRTRSLPNHQRSPFRNG
jgi:hypothetical protein